MKMKVRSKQIDCKNHRILVLSDLHGNGHLLPRLLEKCDYRPGQDHLFILGDLIEKGQDSLGTLHQVMELAKAPLVEVLMGNCDAIPLQLIHKDDLFGLCHYLEHAPWSGYTLIQEMAKRLGMTLSLADDYEAAFEKIVSAYPDEFAFLAQLPHVIESEQYLFAHAGVEQETAPYAKDAYTIMKNDRFALKDMVFTKPLLCGHTPVINYHQGIPCANPLYDENRHIYSIDGGCGVKQDGQLNALIIEQGKYQFCYVDDLPQERIIKDHQAEPHEVITINWFDREVKPIEEEGKGVRCFHPASGKELILPMDGLYEEQGVLCTRDFSNHHLTIQKDAVVGVIQEWEDEVYVKWNGVYGWIPKAILSSSD